MEVRWVTAFIDRPAETFDTAVRFWAAVTASTLSPVRGEHHQFATLVPPDGDAYMRVQRTVTGGGTHLDLHVEEVRTFARHAMAVGGTLEQTTAGPVVMHSPAGMTFCVVAHHGESRRPSPVTSPRRVAHLVDQICIDIPSSRFERECDFWASLTGLELRRSSVRPEFSYLVRPSWSPLRLLLQRREDEDGTATAHLDLATDNVEGLVDDHRELGAAMSMVFEYWTCMTDPAGMRYCITSRDPRTSLLP